MSTTDWVNDWGPAEVEKGLRRWRQEVAHFLSSLEGGLDTVYVASVKIGTQMPDVVPAALPHVRAALEQTLCWIDERLASLAAKAGAAVSVQETNAPAGEGVQIAAFGASAPAQALAEGA